MERSKRVKGRVVLMKKGVLDFHDIKANVLDRVHELLGKGVSLQLISATTPDPGLRGKLGKVAHLERWVSTITSLTSATDTEFTVTFEWDESMGVPGAFIIRNNHHSQFYLKTVTIEDIPGHGPVNFVCNSWIYPAHRYAHDRVFFANKAYLPYQTPEPLRKFREQELIALRGKGFGKLNEWDRVYDYAYYNDLGLPDDGPDYARPVLGGSQCPYPRRGRTGRPHCKTDPKTESRLRLLNLNVYVPRDEQFGHVKFSDFLAYSLKSVAQVLLPEIKSLCDKTINEFDTFEDVLDIYEGSIKLPSGPLASKLRELVPYELLRELIRNDGERFLKFPVPDVIKVSKTAWRTDEEFAREMLAGVNPVIIRRLQEFPPASKLDSRVYGDQTSSIRATHIENSLDGLTIDEVLIRIYEARTLQPLVVSGVRHVSVSVSDTSPVLRFIFWTLWVFTCSVSCP
ncbi:hypothetical protein GLYMA_U039300v4, partial [Glycine max]